MFLTSRFRGLTFERESTKLNKAFKSDSQRLAVSVLIVGFCVYGGMVTFLGGVAHTLMRRYV